MIPRTVLYMSECAGLPNSFEEAGHGFGFTYNHMPGFIRIDHQFHDPELTRLEFRNNQLHQQTPITTLSWERTW